MSYIMFSDDYSSYKHIYPLRYKCKDEVISAFKTYIALAERQTGCKLKQFTPDGGGEFINSAMEEFCCNLGIWLHVTAAHTPSQNGVSERGNKTISQKATAMMIQSAVPLLFWFKACSMEVFLTNQPTSTSIPKNTTPFERWHFRKPSVKHLKVFGCQSFIHVRKEVWQSKFSPISSEGVLLGFTEENFNYRVYSLAEKKVIITHYVTFHEDEFPFLKGDTSPDIFDSNPSENHLQDTKSVKPAEEGCRLSLTSESIFDNDDVKATGETTNFDDSTTPNTLTPESGTQISESVIQDENQAKGEMTNPIVVNDTSRDGDIVQSLLLGVPQNQLISGVTLPIPEKYRFNAVPPAPTKSYLPRRGKPVSYNGMSCEWY